MIMMRKTAATDSNNNEKQTDCVYNHNHNCCKRQQQPQQQQHRQRRRRILNILMILVILATVFNFGIWFGFHLNESSLSSSSSSSSSSLALLFGDGSSNVASTLDTPSYLPCDDNNNKQQQQRQQQQKGSSSSVLSSKSLLSLSWGQQNDNDNDNNTNNDDNDNSKEDVPDEGVIWMWFQDSPDKPLNPRSRKELLASVWSVKANSWKPNKAMARRNQRENFHTTLICDAVVYEFLWRPFLNMTTDENNNTNNTTNNNNHNNKINPLTTLLDKFIVFNNTDFLLRHFPNEIAAAAAAAAKDNNNNNHNDATTTTNNKKKNKKNNNNKKKKKTLYSQKALMGHLSPYKHRTLFLDLDVFVVQPTFVRTMMNFVSNKTTGFDMVQPQVWALRHGTFTDTIPLGCTCIIAFQKTSATRQIFEEWIRYSYFTSEEEWERTILRDMSFARDQELLWYAIESPSSRRPADFKYFQLPLEYQCPLSQNINDMWTYRTKLPDWNKFDMDKPFSEVPCKVIHSHGMLPAIDSHYQCATTGTIPTTTTSSSNSAGKLQLPRNAPKREIDGVDICDMIHDLDIFDRTRHPRK